MKDESSNPFLSNILTNLQKIDEVEEEEDLSSISQFTKKKSVQNLNTGLKLSRHGISTSEEEEEGSECAQKIC